MYKERLKSANILSNNIFFIFLVIIGLMLFIKILNFFSAYIIHIPFLSYIYFILFIYLGWYLINKKIAEFIYTLTEDKLIFEKQIGSVSKIVLSLSLNDVQFIAPIRQYKNTNAKKIFKMTHSPKSNSAYFAIFENNSQKGIVIFQPSAKLLDLLKKQMPDKVSI